MTEQEKQEIISAVLSAIRTNSKTIAQLSPKQSLNDSDMFEVEGGSRVTYLVLKNAIREGLALASQLSDYLTEENAAIYLAKLDTKTGTIDSRESPCVMLDGFKDVNGYTPVTGDLYYENKRGYQIWVKDVNGESGWKANTHATYVNKNEGAFYRWTGTKMERIGGGVTVINDLTTGGEGDALSAEMGKELKQMIDNVELPMDDTENADLDFQDEEGNVIMRLVNGHIKTKNFNSAEIDGGGGSATQEISILFVGNSLLQDAVSYLPLVLKEIAPNLTFKFYMWYDAGTTLAQLLSKWNSNGSAEIFSTCENVTSWTNANNSQKMGTFLASGKTFDIVVLEEYFNLKTESGYTAEDKQAFNDVVAYLRTNYNKPFKVVSFFHRPRTNAYGETPDLAIADEVFELTKEGIQWQLQNTISESVIPAGIAAYRAMYDNTLNALGTLGYMSPDGTHAQEGLPSLMQAWVSALWLLDELSIPASINNVQGRVTSANWSSINVPGPNPWSNPQNNIVVGTTAQDRAAMDIAIEAYKEGKYIELNALTSYTE